MPEKELTQKGYRIILSVSKSGIKSSEADFSEVPTEIRKAVEELMTT